MSATIAQSCGRGSVSPKVRPYQAWNAQNNPKLIGEGYEYRFEVLQNLKETSLEVKPWTSSYFPTYKAGIAHRFMNNDKDGFTYPLLTKEDVLKMTPEELMNLSPAEKYDIYMGGYDFPLVKSERKRTTRVSPPVAKWEGLCHGWAAASLTYDEPKAVTLKSKDGLVDVHFSTGDIKALLTYGSAQFPSKTPTRYLGQRCKQNVSNPIGYFFPECMDVNAGAFHLVLTNQIGIRKQGFVMDATRMNEVWNHPVHSYKTRVVSEQGPSLIGAAKGTKKEVVVETQVWYTTEIAPIPWATNNTNRHADASKTYKYRLELNEAGEIIGGEWYFESPIADFLWLEDRPNLPGQFQGIEEIYNAGMSK
jgi:hypothetical protein